MDGRRFDDLARALAFRGSRRRLLAGSLAAGAAAVSLVATRRGGTVAQSCPGEGEPCGLMIPCCPGFGCVTLLTNPNAGVCVEGAEPRSSSNGGEGSGNGGTGGNGGGNDDPPATSTPRATATTTANATLTPNAMSTPIPTPDPNDANLDIQDDFHRPIETTRTKNNDSVPVTIARLGFLEPEASQGVRGIILDV